MQFHNIAIALGYTFLNFGCMVIARIDHITEGSSGEEISLLPGDYGLPIIVAFIMRTILLLSANLLAIEIVKSRVANKFNLRVLVLLWAFVTLQLHNRLHIGGNVPLIDGLLILTLAITYRGTWNIAVTQPVPLANWRYSVGLAIINCYSGLYFSENLTIDLLDIVAPLFFVFALMSTTFVNDGKTFRRIASRMVISVFLISVLLMAYLEYRGREIEVSYVPLDRPWRSLYFSIILGVYLSIPFSWTTVYRDRSEGVTQQEYITSSILISTICMITMPILFCFTPHGIALAFLSNIWIVTVHIVNSSIFRGLRLRTLGSTFLMVTVIGALFVILVLDRVYYYSLLSVLAPTFPIGQSIFAILFGSGMIAMILGKPKRFINDILRAWQNRSDFVTKCNSVIAATSLSFILLYVLMHKMFDYGNQLSSSQRGLNIVRVPLDGLSGLSSWSWAGLSYLVGLVAILSGELAFYVQKRRRLVN